MANTKKSRLITILVAWLAVSIPLGWGIYNTAINAAKLFHRPPHTIATTPTR